MEEKAKNCEIVHGPCWLEIEGKVKNNPQLSKQLEAAKRVMEKYSDTLQWLAVS